MINWQLSMKWTNWNANWLSKLNSYLLCIFSSLYCIYCSKVHEAPVKTPVDAHKHDRNVKARKHATVHKTRGRKKNAHTAERKQFQHVTQCIRMQSSGWFSMTYSTRIGLPLLSPSRRGWLGNNPIRAILWAAEHPFSPAITNRQRHTRAHCFHSLSHPSSV